MMKGSFIVKWIPLIGLMFLVTNLKAEKLIIGVEEIQYAPYYFLENGQYQGFARHLFDAFGEQFGYDIEYKPYPIKRLYHALIDQSIDLKFPDNPNWGGDVKQQHTIYYSRPIVGYTDGVMVKNPAPPIAIEQLHQIALVRGFSPWPLMPYIDQKQVKTREVNSLKSALLLTLDDRVQGAYFNVKVAQYLMINDLKKEDALTLSTTLPHDQNNYFASTGIANRQETLNQLQQFLQSDQGQALFKQHDMKVNPE